MDRHCQINARSRQANTLQWRQYHRICFFSLAKTSSLFSATHISKISSIMDRIVKKNSKTLTSLSTDFLSLFINTILIIEIQTKKWEQFIYITKTYSLLSGLRHLFRKKLCCCRIRCYRYFPSFTKWYNWAVVWLYEKYIHLCKDSRWV